MQTKLPFDPKEAQLLFSEDVNKLYQDVGKTLIPVRLGASPDQEEFETAGRTWFAKHRQELAEALCPQPLFNSLINSASTDRRLELVAVIFDAVTTRFTQMPVLTISVLVAKELAHLLCADFNKAKR